MRETLPHSLVDLKLTESVLSAVVKTHFTIFAVPFIHSFRFFFSFGGGVILHVACERLRSFDSCCHQELGL